MNKISMLVIFDDLINDVDNIEDILIISSYN